MERIFGSVGRGPGWSGAVPGLGGGLGSMMAGSFLGKHGGTVLGSMVAQHFFASHPEAHAMFGTGNESSFDHPIPVAPTISRGASRMCTAIAART
jgi:hypothetical protein